VVGPNEAMIYIRNGKIEDVLTQDKLKIEKQGIIGWFKSKIGGGDLIQLLFVSTSVIDLNLQIGKSAWKLDPAGKVQINEMGEKQWEVQGILSKDNHEIRGTCTIRIQINQNNAKLIFNLMRSAEDLIARKVEAKSSWWGRNIMDRAFNVKPAMVAGKFLFKSDLEEKVSNELLAKVLYPQLNSLNGDELKGNLELIKHIETATEVEMRKSFELWGMHLVQFFTVFDRSASDALAAHKKKKELIFEQAEFDKDIDMKSVVNERKREYEVDKNDLEMKWAITFGEEAGKIRLSQMKQDGSLSEDEKRRMHELAMRKAEEDEKLRLEKLKHDEEIRLKIEEQKLREREAEHKRKIESDEETSAMDMFIKLQDKKRERITAEQAVARQGISSTDEQLKEMNRQAHEFRMQLANPQTPADRLPYITEALKQITEEIKHAQAEGTKRQASAVGGDTNVAFMNAEGQKHNLETARQTEDRERAHDLNRRRSDADLLDAAKPNVPQYVGGGGYMQPQQPALNVVTIQGSGSSQPQQSGTTCPGCGEPVKPKWKVCPECKHPLQKKSSTCPGCGIETISNWKACPECGKKL
jgi:hypothetical protein